METMNAGVIRASTVVLGLLLSSGVALADPLPAGWTTNGHAGSFAAADGVVSIPPGGFLSYVWLSTTGSPMGGGNLPVAADLTGEETDGTLVTTPTFTVTAGDKLKLYFNYITSDGDKFSDYAWAGLFLGTNTFDSYLFTARTTPSGDTVPGFGLPGLGSGVTLTPAITPIIAGGPAFSPLDWSSGACYGAGCGYTDWIQMDYVFASAGTYSLQFGVTNALDTALNSAFAVAGVTINDVSIGIPEPATHALIGLSLLGFGALRRSRGRVE